MLPRRAPATCTLLSIPAHHLAPGVSAKEPTALYVGNMMSGMLSNQQHLGPLLASAVKMDGVETLTAEVDARVGCSPWSF
jgi:hypothetical protein